MKSSRRQRDDAQTVSLLPFLAVLLCTMGALLLVLVGMAHVTRDKTIAEAQSAAPPVEAPDPQAEQRREFVAKADQVVDRAAQEEAKLDAKLKGEQLRLGQIEDHIRRLRDRIMSLRGAIAEVFEENQQRFDDHNQAQRELDRLNELIAEYEQDIKQLREEQSERQETYAILPYQGANGTQRRPIYIECLKDRVLLQPEGIELSEEDFRKPLGVGNPLASALGATREYLVRNAEAGRSNEPYAEPYPLVLVRPGGIISYYAVRSAIAGWDSDFGYELVDEDWELAYPQPNPTLADLQARAIERSRQRRAILAQAAPRAYGGGAGAFGLKGSGAVVGKPYDRELLSPAAGTSGGGRNPESQDSITLGASAGSSRFGENGTEGESTDEMNPGAERDSQSALANADNRANAVGEDERQLGTYSPTDAGAEAGKMQFAGAAPGETKGEAAGAEATGEASSQGADSPTQQSMAGGTPGEDQPFQQASSGAESGSPTGGNTLSAVANAAVAGERGTNWASNQKSAADIPIRRQVPVEVRADRITVLPPRNVAPADTTTTSLGGRVVLSGPTRSHVDEFVAAVQRHVRTWGMAGQGLYWRPVLQLSVTADGVGRARDLAKLLQDSGIDVEFVRTAQQTGASRE